MRIDIVTAFPGLVEGPLQESIIKRARKNHVVDIRVHDLRRWTNDRHQTIDDTPYGGGAGMVFKIEPLYECLSELTGESQPEDSLILVTSPRGVPFVQESATKFSLKKHIILICGHYKGIDERIKEFFPVNEISIGDYVLSGGELAAMVITDAIVRLLPGAISDINSALSDSFNDDLLDCAYYTRPEKFKGVQVPEVLLSGDHQKIEEWRYEQRQEVTKKNRPDLYKRYLKRTK